MAHRSKKKHIKHLHQHEQAAAAADGPSSEGPRKGRLSTKAREAARAGIDAARSARSAARAAVGSRTGSGAKSTSSGGAPFKGAGNAGAMGSDGAAKAKAEDKNPGLVRSIASAAGAKITAKPRKIISRAKARVKSLFGRDAG